MRKAIFAACIGLFVVGCSSGGGALSAAEKSYTFTVNPKQGQTFNYDMTIGGAMTMNMSMSMTAEKVDNGQTTFRSKIKSMSMNGQAVPPAANEMLSKMSIVQVMDKTGKALSTNYEGMPAGTPPPSQTGVTTASFPDHPVKVGDTWTAKAQNTTATYKFVSVSTENGKQVANFDVTMAETPQLKPDGPAKLNVDIDTGMPVSMNMSGTANGQKVTMSMKQAP